ncbi:phytoene/squalene synthase family protein [Neolewinella agarilytica]|uniref:Phytoene/squalene synthetase n=1 Tax=Neolewinella agarilytica TaxID=478744 RepID=A0A1H9F2S9_9BACT|nr:phytoene/squalene synthase family protein [Neolewinella agarilytica]SEQ32266.1 Phytoene/squalene synthetase [Neolewinella agarilytica]
MFSLYQEVCRECASLITRRYSTSFSLGIRVFDKPLRAPIYGIYGFVRFADEIVDTFHDKDKATLLERFRQDTYLALEEGISLNPVLQAFQEVANRYNIGRDLIDPFLDSMAMDLDFSRYHDDLYKEYIYGSAEVVGLMCLKVFVDGDEAEYERLKDSACALGSAFQKINFLRDIKSDYEERGRVYFPGVDYNNFTAEVKAEIEADIKADFDFALTGIKQLPGSARLGVYLAYVYYTKLFQKIKNSPATRVAEERIRVADGRKVYLLATSAVRARFGLL